MNTQDAVNAANQNPATSNPWFFFLVACPIGFGVWLIPLFWEKIVGPLTVFVCLIPFAIVAVLLVNWHACWRARRRYVFENSTEHTHDDNCDVCGVGSMFGAGANMFGHNGITRAPAYVIREARKCRHGTDEPIEFTEEEARRRVREALQ